MSYIVEIHSPEHGWMMVGFNNDPAIAAEMESEAEAAVRAGILYGFSVDEYRVRTADTSDWRMD